VKTVSTPMHYVLGVDNNCCSGSWYRACHSTNTLGLYKRSNATFSTVAWKWI